MEEDDKQSPKFENSEESKRPDGQLLRVSETTETTVTMETKDKMGLLLWKQSIERWVNVETIEEQQRRVQFL